MAQIASFALASSAFDTAAFLANSGLGRTIIELAPKQTLYSQGDPADAVFYLQKGRAKITVVSVRGKEATITLLVSAGDFVGEGALTGVPGLRLSTATAITACTALKIGRDEMTRVLHEEHEFSDLFLKFLLAPRRTAHRPILWISSSTGMRKAAGGKVLLLMAGISPATGRAGRFAKVHSQDFAGDACRDGRNHPVPRQLLHEPFS